MKKVLIIMGSPRKLETFKVTQIFANKLKEQGEVEVNYIYLKDANLQMCKGCFLCLTKGEEFCPLKDDDRDKIFNAMMESDGVIFTTPNYSLQVTALLKNMLDRLAYIFHRPCCFHKSFTSIVTQGVFGGGKIVKYLNEVGQFWGFRTLKGLVLTILPGDKLPREQKAIEEKTEKHAKDFYKLLNNDKIPVPKLFRFMLFRLTRTSQKYNDQTYKDYKYFKEKGWFESDYFYETKIGVFRKLLGKLIDKLATSMALKGNKEREEFKSSKLNF